MNSFCVYVFHIGAEPENKTRPAGLEPATFGFEVRDSKNISQDNQETCETAKTPLTLQLAPEYQKTDEIDTKKLPSDLAEIVVVWPELPGHIKAAIKALVQTQKGEKE
ncbi:MAG: hypothetical protein ACYTGS_11130 [Planctomycetota bacterium]